MPSLKEIKGRIASVNSTRKITSAMKMVPAMLMCVRCLARNAKSSMWLLSYIPAIRRCVEDSTLMQ